MAVKNFIRYDKIPATAHAESVVSSEEALIGGQFVNLGTVLTSSQGEEVDYTKAEQGGTFDAIVAPVYLENELNQLAEITEQDTPVGKPVRAFIIQKGDMISINEELAEGVVKGDEVQIGEDGLGFAPVDAVSGGTVIGKVIDTEFYPNVGNLVVIRFA